MSKKKKAASNLPSDQFTWTDGSGMLLDTFRHDMEEGAGVSEAGRLPQTKGMSSLPPGILTPESSSQAPYGTHNYTHDGGGKGRLSFDENQLVDLSVVLSSDRPRLPALDWLEVDESDMYPDLLPKNCIDSIPELEEAWGVRRRTDGLSIDNPLSAVASRLESNTVDLAYARSQSLEKSPTLRRFSSRDLKDIKRTASRRIAAGDDIRQVLADTANLLGEESSRVSKAMTKLQGEVGLLGNVYIKASSYPACHQGDWTEHVAKTSRTAKYVVAGKKCSGCVFGSGGSCQMFGKSLVASVPWNEALDSYRNYFDLSGVRLASGDAKEALRSAFLAPPVVAKREREHPVDQSQAFERLEARLAKHRIEEMHRDVAEVRVRQAKLKTAKLAAYLHHLRDNGLLTEVQTKSLLASSKAPVKVYKMAKRLVVENQNVVSSYQGGDTVAFSGKRNDSALDAALERHAASAGEISKSEIKGAVRKARQWLNDGLFGEALDDKVNREISSEVRIASDNGFARLRKTHEVLAGRLFIDPLAYGKTASACEQGAQVNKDRDIPYVLRMAACSQCVFRNQHDGCSKYARELVSLGDFEDSELDGYRNQVLSAANEVVELPVENPVEDFDLRSSSSLEDFDYFDRSGDSLDITLGEGWDL